MADPSASRRSILAVWHWPKWVWVPFAAMTPVTYLLSEAPVNVACFRIGMFGMYGYVREFYAPARKCREHLKIFDQISAWQYEILLPPLPYIEPSPGNYRVEPCAEPPAIVDDD